MPEFPPDLQQGQKWAEAVRTMGDRPYLKSQAFRDKQAVALQHWMTTDGHLVGANPDIVEFTRVFVRRMAALGVPVYPHNMIRDGAWQDLLNSQGNSKTRDSPHEKGCAVDIVHVGKAWSLTDQQWLVFGHVGKELAKAKGLKLTWGGDWKPNANGVGWDPAHWQLTNWKADKAGYPFVQVKPWVANWREVLKRAEQDRARMFNK